MAETRGDGWSPMEGAPQDEMVRIRTAGGWVLKAALWSGFLDGDGNDCSCWCAVDEGSAPPCWDDDVCWATNSAGVASDPPVAWQPVELAQ